MKIIHVESVQFTWQKCWNRVLYLLILASLVICSPIPPQLSPTASSSYNGGTILSSELPSSSSEDLTTKDILTSHKSYDGSPKSTPILAAPTGSSRPYPEVRVTSEVRTVSLQIAEGGVPMMKHMIHPLVFGKPEETFMEPTEVEAPDATPTASSLVTSIPSKVVFVSPSPSSSTHEKKFAYPSDHTVPSPSINGSPENITILNENDKPREVITIIKSKEHSEISSNSDTIEKESPMDIGTLGPPSSGIILDVGRDKRIFPSKKAQTTVSKTDSTNGTNDSNPTPPQSDISMMKSNDTVSSENNTVASTTLNSSLMKDQISRSEPDEGILESVSSGDIDKASSGSGAIKLEPRQANAASYYATEDPIEALSPTEHPIIDVDDKGETIDSSPNNSKEPETDTKKIPLLYDSDEAFLSEITETNSKIIDLNKKVTKPPMDTNSKVDIINNRNIHTGSEQIFYDSMNEKVQKIHNPENSDPFQIPETELDSGSTESYRISAVKGRPDVPNESRKDDEQSQYPQSELIAQNLPANNAHLIPGVLNSRSLEPLVDSFDQDSSSLSPKHQEETPVSEQIKEPVMSPILMGFSFVILIGLFFVAGFGCRRLMYKHSGIRPKQLTDRSCSNSDSGGYFDDQCRVAYVNSQLDVSKATPDDLVSLDNDSFLNSLESMTIQNLWTDSIRHTKL